MMRLLGNRISILESISFNQHRLIDIIELAS